MAENSDRSANSERGIGRPFPKGVSGNPGGRPRGIVRLVRSSTNDGEELVQFMVGLLRGDNKEAKLADRISACEWLAERGFGRSITVCEIDSNIKYERIHEDGVLSELAGIEPNLERETPFDDNEN